jgi:hypothetical protein
MVMLILYSYLVCILSNAINTGPPCLSFLFRLFTVLFPWGLSRVACNNVIEIENIHDSCKKRYGLMVSLVVFKGV